jgi:hypothetical protein
MPSHGALKETAAVAEPQQKKMPKELRSIELRKAENGGAVAEHSFTHYEHKPETHVFGAGDGRKLSAHLEKHLGISMPGKSKTDSAEETEGDEE